MGLFERAVRARSRALIVVASTSFALALAAAPLAVTVPPAEAAPPTPTAIDVDSLRAKAEAATAELVASTDAWRKGKRQLDQARDQLTAVRSELKVARKASDTALVDLGRYASAAYRSQTVPAELTVLFAAPSDASDALHSLQLLKLTGGTKTDIVTVAAELAERTETIEAQAARLAEQAADTAGRLATDLAAIKVSTKRTTDALTSALAELERIERAKRAAAARKAADRERAATRAKRASTAESRVSSSCVAGTNATAGYANGLIPSSALCSIGGGFKLRADAAKSFAKLNAAYIKRFGTSVCIRDSYRSLAEQHRVFAETPWLAAVPGTSNHGWGKALDLCGGIQTFGTTTYNWMKSNAGRFGWIHPAWAEPSGSMPEAWHWEYTG